MKTITTAALLAALAMPVLAQPKPDAPTLEQPAAAASATDMTDGEIRKVDKDAKKITIRHGEIKNLDMPPMTMVFQVQDSTMLERVKVGDKIRFTAQKGASGYVVTDIQTAPAPSQALRP